MPFELDEYYRGQLYAVSETSKNETGGGDGVEVLEDDDFTSTTVRPGHSLKGVYTHKIYRTKSKSPWVLRKLFPDTAFVLHEECWNAFPYCKTIIKALDLSPTLLKKREVVVIDIYDDSFLKRTRPFFFAFSRALILHQDITPETDVHEYESKKTGRGKLLKDWVQNSKPVMCCYKVRPSHLDPL
ncbi:unnamed protein product [Gongylonema pulchrum]|uniref:Phosphatidylinositol transfer protein n=1 Tax=Gongylonema pulchrum TaxID=637853 RepID=A0A183D0T5_9BILA|nr:unnamed protein product [Gongylonema pulchrum]